MPQNPVHFDRGNKAYLGALFEIEDFNNGVASPLATHEASPVLVERSSRPGRS